MRIVTGSDDAARAAVRTGGTVGIMDHVDRAAGRFVRWSGNLAFDRLRIFPPTAGFWVVATLIALFAALAVVGTFEALPVPPGGDPGTWVATSYVYIGHAYPTELNPLGYPPILFPLLGASVLAAGGPIPGVDLFAGLLMLGLGLSLAYLARTLIRSGVIALTIVALILADPSIWSMFFWGAYPNLLAFVFLNVAFAGLLRAGQGRQRGQRGEQQGDREQARLRQTHGWFLR